MCLIYIIKNLKGLISFVGIADVIMMNDMINELEFYGLYLEYSYIYEEMLAATLRAKASNPGMDATEAHKKMDIVKNLQTQFSKMFQYVQMMENQNAKFWSTHVHQVDEIEKLKKENEELKSNIGFD